MLSPNSGDEGAKSYVKDKLFRYRPTCGNFGAVPGKDFQNWIEPACSARGALLLRLRSSGRLALIEENKDVISGQDEVAVA